MRLTLRQVLQRHPRVVIPLLQRDYAQGRPEAAALRDRFLEVLARSLDCAPEDPRLPLDLDFVYGSVDEDGAFLPLDGQQRLTTLFLLHWYLALRDGVFQDFQSWALGEQGSVFSYRVRPSSADFLDALIAEGESLSLTPSTESPALRLSERIRDRPWFYQSWTFDPSIASFLVMLDSIDARFRDLVGGYARLLSSDAPAITFQFLDLEQFDLSDELYIKMNARGKPLTVFETFKASLEGVIPALLPGATRSLAGVEVGLALYIGQQFDTRWCDLFWAYQDQDHSLDHCVMSAVRAVALLSLVIREEDQEEEALLETLSLLRQGRLLSFQDLERRGCISPRFLEVLTALLDHWAAQQAGEQPFLEDSDYYREEETLRRFLWGPARRDALPYEDWVQFVGCCLFRLSGQSEEELGPWMRLVSNLARNTLYNRSSELLASLRGLWSLLQSLEGGLLTCLAEERRPLRGFNVQQLREERLKAQLMRRSPVWARVIREAEVHGYFRGQLEFLFAYSGVLDRWLEGERAADWSEEEDGELFERFEFFRTRAEAVFQGGEKPGLRAFPDFLFERALLCEGNYLLRRGHNHSLLDSSDRDLSWKRLLRGDQAVHKRAFLGALLEQLDPSDLEGSLRARIRAGVRPDPEERFPGWRAVLVERPDLIAYCRRRQLRSVEGASIYLLSKKRRSGYHRELFTAKVFPRIQELAEAGELGGLRRASYAERTTDTVDPGIELFSADGEWVGWIRSQEADFVLELPPALRPKSLDSEASWRVSERGLVRALRGAGAALEAGSEGGD